MFGCITKRLENCLAIFNITDAWNRTNAQQLRMGTVHQDTQVKSWNCPTILQVIWSNEQVIGERGEN